MGWTNWRYLAERGHWSDDALDWNGAASYELAIAGRRGGDLRIVYVGETVNERRRIAAYARDGSHLSSIIAQHLRDGWTLWYRARAADTKDEAKAMQDRLLARHDYDWNIILNTKSSVQFGPG